MTARKSLVLLLLALVAGALLLTGRQTVADNRIGVRIGPLGRVTAARAGERLLVLPGIQKLIELPADPVQFVMAGQGAIPVETNGQPGSIGCQVRYQIVDGARLLGRHGADAPQAGLERTIREQVQRLLAEALARDPASLDEVGRRIVLVAATHHELATGLADAGVSVQSFELLSW